MEKTTDVITVVFTKNIYSPISWLVRWVLPRSRFAWGLSSHCYIDAGDFMYEADPFKGVRMIQKDIALNSNQVVKVINYTVPDRKAGFDFLNAQLGKKYDFKGAIGMGITAERDWSEDDKFFCYELAACALKAAGRNSFNNLHHIGEISMMSICPTK